MSPIARNSPSKRCLSRRSRAIEYPRPSVNCGKSIAISGRAGQSGASRSGSSAGLSQTPISLLARSASRCASHNASGTIAGSPFGTSASEVASRSSVQRSSAIAPSLMSCGIDALLERLDAQPADRVGETLVLVTALDIDLDQGSDHVGHLARRERRADDLAQRRRFALRAADRDLVPLGAVLVDAEHADVADVMMATGVHATGDIEIDFTDVVQVIEIVEAALDRFSDRNRLCVGERAEVPARAADDVGQQPDVGRGEAERLELAPEREECRLLHVGEDQILL